MKSSVFIHLTQLPSNPIIFGFGWLALRCDFSKTKIQPLTDLQEKVDLVTERVQFLEGVLELDDPVEQEMGVSGTAGDAGRDAGPSSDQDILEGNASKVSGSVGEDTDSVSVSQELAKGKVIKVPTIGLNMGIRY